MKLNNPSQLQHAVKLWITFIVVAIAINGTLSFALGGDKHEWVYPSLHKFLPGLAVYGILFTVFRLVIVKDWQTVRQPKFILPLLIAVIALLPWNMYRAVTSPGWEGRFPLGVHSGFYFMRAIFGWSVQFNLRLPAWIRRMIKTIKKGVCMKKTALLIVAALAVSLSGACALKISDPEQGRKNLVAFFEFLNQGEYDRAAKLYGGSYEALVDMNPAMDPEDHTALLKNGCEINGFQCLAVLTADFKAIDAQGEYIFVVQFKDADGMIFVQEMLNAPPVFIFEYRVRKTPQGNFVVLDLPVYVP